MNERIKEIYLEATKSITGSRDIDAGKLALLGTIDEYDLKFAELIVLECIKIAHDTRENENAGNNLGDFWFGDEQS